MARRLWARVAAHPTPDTATALDPVERSRVARIILWLKVATAIVEALAGIGLFVFGMVDVNIGTSIRHAALRELQQDPGDFVSRHIIAGFPALTRVNEIVVGVLLAAYGALKGGVVLAVLRHHHRVAIVGAVVFTLVALGAAFVLFRHPTPIRAALGLLDVAVAVVLWREALSLRRHALRR